MIKYGTRFGKVLCYSEIHFSLSQRGSQSHSMGEETDCGSLDELLGLNG